MYADCKYVDIEGLGSGKCKTHLIEIVCDAAYCRLLGIWDQTTVLPVSLNGLFLCYIPDLLLSTFLPVCPHQFFIWQYVAAIHKYENGFIYFLSHEESEMPTFLTQGGVWRSLFCASIWEIFGVEYGDLCSVHQFEKIFGKFLGTEWSCSSIWLLLNTRWKVTAWKFHFMLAAIGIWYIEIWIL